VNSLISRKLVVGATGLVLLGGAAGAVAATQFAGGSSQQAFINDVAARLNVTPTALTAAMKASEVDRIQAAVTAGRITQAQATTIGQRIQQGNGLHLFGHRFSGGTHPGLTAAAQYLGITETALRADLQGGKSLAAIASANPGKSTAGLKAAIIASEKNRLHAKVASGTITSAQEQQRLSDLSSRIDTLLNRTWTGASGFGVGFRSRRY
jgi:hypothetical protein